MIRIYNAKILTMENGMQPFDGEIQTDGSRISYIGEKPMQMTCRCSNGSTGRFFRGRQNSLPMISIISLNWLSWNI